MWSGIDGKPYDRAQLHAHIVALPATIWASGMVLHNTAAPNLSQWTPQNRANRIINLERFFRDERGWSSGPHAFVDYDYVWGFTPFTKKGTHSPSWNGTKIGIEMVGDFRPGVDDPRSGLGLKVYKNTVALFAMLHEKYGWNPETIKLHKEDPRTTHDCPGASISKDKFIEDVLEFMGHAGELDHAPEFHAPPVKSAGTQGVVINVPSNDTLNVRPWPSTGSDPIAFLKDGSQVSVTASAKAVNGVVWYRIEPRGWVNSRFVKLET